MSRRVGVILAGGQGQRMGAGRNKALLELCGRPILLHSVEVFRACCDRLLVVSAAVDLPSIQDLLPELHVIAGGATRHDSEWQALQALQPGLAPDDLVAIHDGARPLIVAGDVIAVFEAAGVHGAAMLVQPAGGPVLRVAAGRVALAYESELLWRAQTPQAARAAPLLEAYGRAAAEGFKGTDTAAVLARYGCQVQVVAASADNPKITLPADLTAAEAILGRRGRADHAG